MQRNRPPSRLSPLFTGDYAPGHGDRASDVDRNFALHYPDNAWAM
jgi:hypothetical protein